MRNTSREAAERTAHSMACVRKKKTLYGRINSYAVKEGVASQVPQRQAEKKNFGYEPKVKQVDRSAEAYDFSDFIGTIETCNANSWESLKGVMLCRSAACIVIAQGTKLFSDTSTLVAQQQGRGLDSHVSRRPQDG